MKTLALALVSFVHALSVGADDKFIATRDHFTSERGEIAWNADGTIIPALRKPDRLTSVFSFTPKLGDKITLSLKMLLDLEGGNHANPRDTLSIGLSNGTDTLGIYRRRGKEGFLDIPYGRLSGHGLGAGWGGNAKPTWYLVEISWTYDGGRFEDMVTLELKVHDLTIPDTPRRVSGSSYLQFSSYDLMNEGELRLQIEATRWSGCEAIADIQISGPIKFKPPIEQPQLSSGPAMEIKWDSAPSKHYVIESQDGPESLWKTITAPIAGQPGTTSHFLPARHPSEIFRVRELE